MSFPSKPWGLTTSQKMYNVLQGQTLQRRRFTNADHWSITQRNLLKVPIVLDEKVVNEHDMKDVEEEIVRETLAIKL